MTITQDAAPLADLRARIEPSVWPLVEADLARFTPEQRAVVRALLETPEHLVVMSTAGSGKSTLLRVLACLLPEGRSAVLAFNVAIAEEIAPRMPGSVLVSPLHRLGLRVLREGCGREVQVVPFKRRNLVGGVLKARGVTGDVSGLTLLCERALATLTPAEEGALLALAGELGVAVPAGVPLVELVREVSASSLRAFRESGQVDFTDMLYLPVKLGWGKGSLDHVLVDEAQDLSRLQLRFVRHLTLGGRLVLIGDEDQSLYGFSGADVGGLSRAVAELPARLLQLTVTFRCPVSHVRLARRFSADIQAAPSAGEGEVREVSREEALAACGAGDLVMARTNAPVVGFALRLAERGVPLTLLGHDVARDLGELARVALPGGFTAGEVEGRVVACGSARLAGHVRRGLVGARLERLVAEDTDRLACVAALALQVAGRGEGSVQGIAALLGRLTRAQPGGVRLCTVHRAKGLEARRAVLLEPQGLLEGEVERSVSFVALTRARVSLWLVGA